MSGSRLLTPAYRLTCGPIGWDSPSKGKFMKSQGLIFAEARAKRQQHHIGAVIETMIFGRMVEGKIIAVHPFGTVDVQVSSLGTFFRVSGIALETKPCI